MVQLFAFRRSLRVVALALCSAAMAVSATPASARSHHRAGRHVHAHYARRHVGRHFAYRYYRHHRQIARGSRWERGVAQMRAGGFANANASLTNTSLASGAMAGGMAISAGFGSSDVVAEARRFIGGNPTGLGRLWCARFMNMVLAKSGHRGTGSDMASSFAHYGQRVSGPQVGAIAVMGRRGGGHVGIITGIDASGNPIMISGNNGNRVREAPVSRGRIYAYVMPAS
jgi:uncharacterized protein (TIGR02594 family)